MFSNISSGGQKFNVTPVSVNIYGILNRVSHMKYSKFEFSFIIVVPNGHLFL